MAGNRAKRSALAAVWSWKVWSTVNPLSASSAAGCISWWNFCVPKVLAAFSHSAGVPGVPMDSPEVTAVAKGYGVPVAGSTNAWSVKDFGAVSRPSMVLTFLVFAS